MSSTSSTSSSTSTLTSSPNYTDSSNTISHNPNPPTNPPITQNPNSNVKPVNKKRLNKNINGNANKNANRDANKNANRNANKNGNANGNKNGNANRNGNREKNKNKKYKKSSDSSESDESSEESSDESSGDSSEEHRINIKRFLKSTHLDMNFDLPTCEDNYYRLVLCCCRISSGWIDFFLTLNVIATAFLGAITSLSNLPKEVQDHVNVGIIITGASAVSLRTLQHFANNERQTREKDLRDLIEDYKTHLKNIYTITSSEKTH